jgi:hypothetical protein
MRAGKINTYVDLSNVPTPDDASFVTIFRKQSDGLVYGKDSTGTVFLISGYGTTKEFRAGMQPANNAIAVGESIQGVDPMDIVNYTVVENDFLVADFNNATGEFTINEPGIYDLNAWVSMTVAGGFTSGYAWMGIVIPSNTEVYSADYVSVPSATQEKLELTTSLLGLRVTAPLTLKLRVMNKTGQPYVSTPGDIVVLTIKKNV